LRSLWICRHKGIW